ncbi:MAG: hypothetical protein A2Y23_06660 [Clostridiales bacterium GWB2_37_7]|nr:MAG: hypothetical protein A2Y23_06660 [Clostridiales bacterium GWB2_37_7]
MVKFFDLGQVKEEKLEFAVIYTEFQDKYVFVRHKDRRTWEVPGGHRELNEDINFTAERELVEETGAKRFNVIPICDYSANLEVDTRYGRLFYAVISEFGELPQYEIEEVKMFDEYPVELTYPEVLPYLCREIEHRKSLV